MRVASRSTSESRRRITAGWVLGNTRGAWQLADHPARLFVCARCRMQVVLCSRCDRGQRYCGPTCSRAARRDSQRAAGARYQRSRAGRMAHAERSRRWRERHLAHHQVRDDDAAAGDDGGINFVTHQGSAAPPVNAPLPLAEQAGGGASEEIDASTPPTTHCRRCATALAPWVRQGFLRHGMRRWPARVIDPCP